MSCFALAWGLLACVAAPSAPDSQGSMVLAKAQPALRGDLEVRIQAHATSALQRLSHPALRGRFVSVTSSWSVDPYDDRFLIVTVAREASLESAASPGTAYLGVMRYRRSDGGFVGGRVASLGVHDTGPMEETSFDIDPSLGVTVSSPWASPERFDGCERCIAWATTGIKLILELGATAIGYGPASFACGSLLLSSAPTGVGPILIAKLCEAALLGLMQFVAHLPLQSVAQMMAHAGCKKLTTKCAADDRRSCDGPPADWSEENLVYYKVPYVDFRRNVTRFFADQRFDLQVWGVRRSDGRRSHWSTVTMKRDRRIRGVADALRQLGGGGLRWTHDEGRLVVHHYPFDGDALYVDHRPPGHPRATALRPVVSHRLGCL